MGWTQILQHYAFDTGPAGLLALSLVDSAGLPTGGAPDLALALLAALRPDDLLRLAFLAAAATVGSAAGCLVLYEAGRHGGRLRGWLRTGLRRWSVADPALVASRAGAVDRWGALAVFLSVLAPPPIPTKLFVLAAGIARVPRTSFVVAVVVGRALRYGAGALVARTYGPQLLTQLRHGSVPAVAVVALVGLLVAFYAIRRWRTACGRPGQP